MLLGQGDPHKQGGKRGAPPLRKCYFTGIGSFSVKIVADRHRHAVFITSTGNELLRNVNIDDLE